MLDGQISARFGIFGTFLQVLPWLKDLRPLLNWPGFDDSAKLRAWHSDLVGFCEKLAKLMPTMVRDVCVSTLAKIVSDDTAWGYLYGILKELVVDGDADGDEGMLLQSVEDDTLALSERVGIPVSVIGPLILMLLQVIKFFRANK